MRSVRATFPATMSDLPPGAGTDMGQASVAFPDGTSGYGTVYRFGNRDVVLTSRGAFYFVETGGYAAPGPIGPQGAPAGGQNPYAPTYQGGGIVPPAPSPGQGFAHGATVAQDISQMSPEERRATFRPPQPPWWLSLFGGGMGGYPGYPQAGYPYPMGYPYPYPPIW